MCRAYSLITGPCFRLTSLLSPSMGAQVEQLGLCTPSSTAIPLLFLVCTIFFTKNGTQLWIIMINIIIIMVITMVIIIASSVFQELTALHMSFLFQISMTYLQHRYYYTYFRDVETKCRRNKWLVQESSVGTRTSKVSRAWALKYYPLFSAQTNLHNFSWVISSECKPKGVWKVREW